MSRTGTFIETKSRFMVGRTQDSGEWGVTASGYGVSVGVMKIFWN